jgi:DNA primase
VIIPDGDEAGYKHVQTIVKKCYPEYEIVVTETPDNEDPGTLSKKFLREIYENAISIEEWLELYKYREPKKKKK